MEPESTGKRLAELGQDIVTLSLPAGDIVIPKKDGRGRVTAEWVGNIADRPLKEVAERFNVSVGELIRGAKGYATQLWQEQEEALKGFMGGCMVVERKTPHDLLHSIEDGRLVDQCRRMVKWSWLPVVLIDGLLGDEDGMATADGSMTGWSARSVEMMLLSLMAGGVSVIGGRGTELGEIVLWLIGWMDKEDHLLPGKRASIPFIEPTVGMDVLTSFSGIGPQTAKNILDYCGSLRNAFMFMTDERSVRLKEKPKGVGAQRIAEFRRAMGMEDGEVMVPIKEEDNG